MASTRVFRTPYEKMESADENDALPVLRSMTGVWALDASRSESLEPLFTAMGVSWLARKLVKNLKIQVQMVHERDSLILCETSVFGTFSTGSLVLDGRSRPVLQVDRIARPMRCRWSQPSAQLTLETVYPTGALVDRRQLQSRTEYRQTLTFQGVTVTRFFTLEETREEQVAAEKAEEAARIALAYQSATMSLLHPQPPSPVEEAEAVDQKTENSAAASSGRSNTGPGLTPGADEPASEPPLFSLTADFSGCWILDKSRSDTLDPMLTLMGLPWIARKMCVFWASSQLRFSRRDFLLFSTAGSLANFFRVPFMQRKLLGNYGRHQARGTARQDGCGRSQQHGHHPEPLPV